MATTIESSGRTLDEAIRLGLAALRVERDSVVVSVVEKPKSGFFGIGSAPAIVTLTLRDNVLSSEAMMSKELVGKWEIQIEEGGAGIFWEFSNNGTYKSINSGKIESEGRYQICGNLLTLDKGTPDELDTTFRLHGNILLLDVPRFCLKKC